MPARCCASTQRATAVFQETIGQPALTPTQFAALIKVGDLGSVSQNHLGRLTAMDPAALPGIQASAAVVQAAASYAQQGGAAFGFGDALLVAQLHQLGAQGQGRALKRSHVRFQGRHFVVFFLDLHQIEGGGWRQAHQGGQGGACVQQVFVERLQ